MCSGAIWCEKDFRKVQFSSLTSYAFSAGPPSNVASCCNSWFFLSIEFDAGYNKRTSWKTVYFPCRYLMASSHTIFLQLLMPFEFEQVAKKIDLIWLDYYQQQPARPWPWNGLLIVFTLASQPNHGWVPPYHYWIRFRNFKNGFIKRLESHSALQLIFSMFWMFFK